MKKSTFFITIFALFFLFFILFFQRQRDKNEELNRIKETKLSQLDSIAFESNFGWSIEKNDQKKIDEFLERKILFFPIKEGVKTCFLDGTVADSLLLCNSFIGYQSGTFVYIFDIYRTKSEKFHDRVYNILKRINANEVTTDPRGTIKWIYSLKKYKIQSLRDFIVHVCFPVREEKNLYWLAETSEGQKENFTQNLMKEILSEKGNSEEGKLFKSSRKIASMNWELSKLWKSLGLNSEL